MGCRGQALIEAMLFGAISMLGLWLLLKTGAHVIYSFCLDELAEEFLLCETSVASNCHIKLENRMTLMGFKVLQLRASTQNGVTQLYVKAQSKFLTTLQATREISLDLSLARK